MTDLNPQTLRQLSAEAMEVHSVAKPNSTEIRDNRYTQVLEHILSKNADLIKAQAEKGNFDCRFYVDDGDLRAVGDIDYFIKLAKNHLINKGYKNVWVGYNTVSTDTDYTFLLPLACLWGFLIFLGLATSYPTIFSPLNSFIYFIFFSVLVFIIKLMIQSKECLTIHLSWQDDNGIEWRG